MDLIPCSFSDTPFRTVPAKHINRLALIQVVIQAHFICPPPPCLCCCHSIRARERGVVASKKIAGRGKKIVSRSYIKRGSHLKSPPL